MNKADEDVGAPKVTLLGKNLMEGKSEIGWVCRLYSEAGLVNL